MANAKKQIAELMPTPLETLPHIGPVQAKGLREFGYECLDGSCSITGR